MRELVGVVLVLALVAWVLTGCAYGRVSDTGAWGNVVGNGRITNCIESTSLEAAQTVDPQTGTVVETKENRINEITERCFTIAGGAISQQGASVIHTLMSPFRAIFGGMSRAVE